MPTTPEAIAADIEEAATAGFRGQLIARGQARAIIWRDGVLPPDPPNFSPQLSQDLLSYGYSLLGLGMRLRELGGDPAPARVAFERSATALEAVNAKGSPEELDRDFHFVIAAASYHLAHLSARAYSLLTAIETNENFSPIERVLVQLMKRNFRALRANILDYRASGEASDDRIAESIEASIDQIEELPEGEGHDFLFDGLNIALTDGFFSAVASFLVALERGERLLLDQALERLQVGLSVCSELNMLPQWWALPEVKHVGEVGLDGAPEHKKSWDQQLEVFNHILRQCAKLGGRLISIHSRRAASDVLDQLEVHRSCGTPILHWFSGTPKELSRAIDIGAWFSVGPAMLRSKRGRDLASAMPIDRLLTETDGPFAMTQNRPLVPGEVETACSVLGEIWGCDVGDVKSRLRINLQHLDEKTA